MNQNIKRSIRPEIQNINPDLFGIDSLMPLKKLFDNEIPYYQINKGTQDVVRVDFMFEAGTAKQYVVFSAFSAIQLLTEGSLNFSADQIAEAFDFYGASFEKESERDFACLSVYSLTKHLEHILPYVEEIIKCPSFPENEIAIFKEKQKTLLEINNQRVSHIARTKFQQQLFGITHPYGQIAEIEDIEKIERKHLAEFHQKYIHSGNCKILISGKINQNVIQLIGKYFGKNSWGKQSRIIEKDYAVQVIGNNKSFILKDDAVQTAVRIGSAIYKIDDYEYHQFKFMNTILGGYFGSRLMKNIREDKGYTYGINSGILRLKYAKYFFIGTEVGFMYTQQCIDEIYKEIKLLRDDLVSDEELSLVRNFKMGEFLRSIDGAFAMANLVKSIIQHDLTIEYIKLNLQVIQNITSEQIKNIANKYLQDNNLHELIVGRK
ncbi:MAG: pitrilysin family protein [Bacteroidetes bacterium]|nr:pitrilysin family protein [Bacteroidota bacterium]